MTPTAPPPLPLQLHQRFVSPPPHPPPTSLKCLPSAAFAHVGRHCVSPVHDWVNTASSKSIRGVGLNRSSPGGPRRPISCLCGQVPGWSGVGCFNLPLGPSAGVFRHGPRMAPLRAPGGSGVPVRNQEVNSDTPAFCQHGAAEIHFDFMRVAEHFVSRTRFALNPTLGHREAFRKNRDAAAVIASHLSLRSGDEDRKRQTG